MGILPRYNSLSLLWKVYFGFLYVAFVIFACLTLYLLFTDGGTDSGILDVYAIQYLFIFAVFIAINAILYKVGERNRYARPVLASFIVIGVAGLTGASIFNSYVNNQYKAKYRPLTRVESLELIKSCQVASVEVGSPRYNDIKLNTKDGKSRTTARFSADNYEEELQRMLASLNC